MWYDNDMDTYQGSCDSAFNTGVNILFKQYSDNSGKNQIPATLFNQLDIDMDSGNGMQCGKVRANAQQYYTMSPSYDTY
ncbi:hypothetical protein H6796_00555 [Candidatus Nomurabacteria bacterium]|nr:hypothetical protein [Candidatus Nomurabacteria bacterium]